MKSLLLCILCLGAASIAARADDLDRGIEAYRHNNFGEAVTIFRGVVQQDDGNGRAHRYLGLALLDQAKSAEAEPHIMKAGELDPGGESKSALARLYVEKRELDKAEEALQDADGEDIAYVRGLLHYQRKHYGDAAREFESFIESQPHHAYAHYHAGMAYNGLKKPDKMLTHFETFLRMKPDAPEARKVQSVLRAVR